MTVAQKIIFWCAIALAALLIVALCVGVLSLLGTFSMLESDFVYDEQKDLGAPSDLRELALLSIELSASELKIERGEIFAIRSNSKHIELEYEEGRIFVTETDHRNFPFFGNISDGSQILTVTIPFDVKISELFIKTGAGRVYVEGISSESIAFELGAGEVCLSDINALSAKIDGGAGKITVSSSVFSNLELKMGVGSLSMSAELSGRSKIDCGVGRVDLELLCDGEVSEYYTVEISKALGSVAVDGIAKNGDVYGNGSNKVCINGGVGSISVK